MIIDAVHDASSTVEDHMVDRHTKVVLTVIAGSTVVGMTSAQVGPVHVIVVNRRRQRRDRRSHLPQPERDGRRHRGLP
jgi:hypothetical protein